MDIELINRDIEVFLDKFTRFMSKKVYITYKMYNNFIYNYDYIYKECDSSIINFNNNDNYKKIMEIRDKGILMLKKHNLKILNYLYQEYNNLFNIDKKYIKSILCEDDKIIISSKNNREDIIKEKIKYLKEVKKVSNSEICLVSNKNIEIEEVKKFNYLEFYNYLYFSNSKVCFYNTKRKIILNYIKKNLFNNKYGFDHFCKMYESKVFITSDYKEFDTFNDYNSYMYKRKFMNSKLDKESFVKKEIINFKRQGIGIDGSKYKSEEVIDIANSMFVSGIKYIYNEEENTFSIYDEDEYCYKLGFKNMKEEDIYLKDKYEDGESIIGHMMYEFVKRMYPIEKIGYDSIYTILKENYSNNYFNKIVDNIIIPFIDNVYINNFDINTKVNDSIREEYSFLRSIYNYYEDYQKDNGMIDEVKLFSLRKSNIKNIDYKYLIIDDEDNIVDKYEIDKRYLHNLFCIKPVINTMVSYLNSNIKLYYDFLEYLNLYKIIPIMDTYYSTSEINDMALKYTKDNIDKVCNVYGEVMESKEVVVYIYNDEEIVYDQINKNKLINNIISRIDKNSFIMGNRNSDLYSLIMGGYKVNNNKYICKDRNIDYIDMDREDKKIYEEGILINPVDGKYDFKHDMYEYPVMSIFGKKKDNWEKKLFYTAISKVKKRLYVVVAKSRSSMYVREVLGHNKVMIKKDIFDIRNT